MSSYDLIVVGGGPGGSAAAKEAADAGLKTIVFERGRFCGEKNSSGFGLSPKAARDFPYIKELDVPSLWPTKFGVMHIVQPKPSNADRMTWGLTPPRRSSYPEASQYMVQMMYRPEFDQWMMEKATSAGAELKLKTLVTNVIRDGEQVVGVVDQDGRQYRAPVVIAADGAHSLLAQKAGLRKRWDKDQVTVLATLDFEADPDRIAEYCGDTNVHIYMGPDRGGYVCIFRSGFHIGSRPAKTLLNEIEAGRNLSSTSVMENAQLDFVQRLIKATRAKPREFQLHFLPWLKKFNERIYTGGLMLTGDAAGVPEPFMAEGVWQAMYSSRLAAQVAARAHRDKDFSKAYFKQYMEELKASPVGVDFTSGAVLRDFFAEWTSKTFYDLFDNVADAMFYGMLTMAEPHAQGMLRVPGIFADMIPQLLFLARYYFPIAEEASREKTANFLAGMRALTPLLQSMMPPATAGGK
ncbi:MAG: NAD(P)/FAD-dependent oxidoreductase [Dehalococcoidia bacterium]|nr:NAD(P)/FAD-dependent oxidoreductase [Dehalococcoidia bacterium]